MLFSLMAPYFFLPVCYIAGADQVVPVCQCICGYIYHYRVTGKAVTSTLSTVSHVVKSTNRRIQVGAAVPGTECIGGIIKATGSNTFSSGV